MGPIFKSGMTCTSYPEEKDNWKAKEATNVRDFKSKVQRDSLGNNGQGVTDGSRWRQVTRGDTAVPGSCFVSLEVPQFL